MKSVPILYWSRKASSDSEYQLARKTISAMHGIMPEVVSGDIDVIELLSKNPESVLYYPVFCESTGWWGELLGGNASVTDKIIISPECQLMAIEIGSEPVKKGQNQLLAAEIYPASGFFKKMNSSIATVADMLATDAGTIIALFSGKNQTQFINVLESTGNSYLGCIGRY
ncbi:MAG: hypothetical protein JW974_01885 [Alphaproteobacteria bacterium]|nr:hypothetical protein [Alphaproteobacteria bacterium]MBN2675530.1 hypothetical protein [Alphaproteobacteria bacterium]